MIKSFGGILLLILAVSSLWIPVDLPFDIESTALVYPIESWELQKNPDGTLLGNLRNHRTGQLEDYSSYQFERGDVIQINFATEASTAGRVDSGALMASIASNTFSQQFIQLENQLAVERAQLQSALVGQKPEIQKEAEEKVRLTEEALLLKIQQLARSEKLFADGLIALAQLEKDQNDCEQAKINIQLAKERLSVVSTGAKPEDIRLIESRITALQKQIDFQQNTSGLYRIYSPIPGELRYENTLEGDKLIVDNTETYIFRVPVKLKDQKFIPLGTQIEWQPLFADTLYHAQLIGWGSKVEILNQEQVVMAQAEMAGPIEGLIFGMPVRCRLKAGAVTPMEYFKRSMDIKLR